ncbi:MAG: PilC/PilY family type IV pilus protein [Gammaproteobacteria bacterium]|nr:PilC/PilY family type IV pilus protein [Gammaproteobacteria bacterium]
MISKKFLKGISIIATSAILGLGTGSNALAAPGPLATAPLFLSTIVEPNVFFTLDDSGSMNWGPMYRDGTAGLTSASGLPFINGLDRAYYSPTFTRLYTNRDVIPPAFLTDVGLLDGFGNPVNAGWDLGWPIFTHHANRNYYNPAVKYTPWPGSKADGTPMYEDANPLAALRDPNDPGGESIDLTVFHTFTEGGDTTDFLYLPMYYEWIDTDADGVVEQTDARFPVFIGYGTPEMQNFANWFQYYRNRINATKAIIGSTINNTDASRMGMRWFNAGQAKDSKTMSDADLKRELLEQLYSMNIGRNGTPMRRALRNTGNYFDNTGSSAPILSAALGGECQQNFNILMGDGFWNGGSPGVGNRDNNGGSGNDNSIFDGNASQSNDGGNYADNESNTLADVAMRDYERDLRTDLANKVPTIAGIDEADHQHLVTYSIAFGIEGTLDPKVDDPLDPGFQWPDPDDGEEERVDDMWHAAYNGRGKYLSAQNPDELEIALNAAIADIAERTATAAAVSINSAKLTTQSVVYLAQFNTNRWQGNLFAFKIADTITGELATTPEWTAAEELNGRNIATDPRTILTHNGTGGAPFQWLNLSAAQQADLRTNPAGGTDAEAVGIARLEYLRGDRKDEGAGYFFRERLSLLGDLVNSGPVFVGAPGLNWPDKAPFPTAVGERYSDFKNGTAGSRSGVVYAGANDGKMHGFDENTGREVLAYVPNILFSTGTADGLHYLTDPNYGHKYYNDLTPSLSDVYANLGNGTSWNTIMVSGLRGGQRGVFALNVTDPSSFSEANASDIVLWEFTNNDDPDLGYTYSRPQIGLANDGSWVAIFGNGYNDTGDGEAKLFILKIEAGVDGTWAPSDYIEISTNSGDAANRNGLATPALADIDGNGTIDRVYAGDLRGQMWAFDLSDSNSAAWDIPGSAPLFTTIGNEPITAQPTLSKHPTESDTGSNSPNLMVFFGSGQYLTNADKTSTDTNYFYGVWDKGDTSLDNTDLVQQFYDNAFTDRVLTRNSINWGGGEYGWYFELPDTGERSVTRPVVRADIVFFNTFVPNSDPCSVGGYGYRFAVEVATGGSPENVVVDVNKDGLIDDNDRASGAGGITATVAAIQQDGFLPEPVFIEDIAYTAETPSKVAKLKDIPKGRFSWQELIQ